MQNRKWLVALLALAIGVGAGLIAGCGSSDSSSTSASSTAASTDTSSSGGSSSGGSSSGGSSISGNATADDVYNACEDAINNASAGQAGCQAAKSAFEQCAQQAASLSGSSKDTAMSACQDAANQAVAALKAAP
jgi:hypothetical protein